MSDTFLRKQQESRQQVELSAVDRPMVTQQQEDEEKRQYESAEQKYKQELSVFEEKNVKLDDGTYISREAFNKLASDEQDILKKQGIDAYQKYFTVKQETELAKNNVKLKSGEWVDKSSYDGLPDEWKKELDNGTSNWSKFWDSKPYGGASNYVMAEINGTMQVYGVTSDPLIGIDKSGMRVYLGDNWPEVAKQYTGKPGAVTTKDIIGQGEKLIPASFVIETPKIPEEEVFESNLPEPEVKDVDVNNLLFDYETGKYYDMSDPYKPQEVELIYEKKEVTEEIPEAKTEVTKKESDNIIDRIGEIVNTVWQTLTPWDESKGETNPIDTILNNLEEIKKEPAKREEDKQNKLQAIYEVEEQLPWWYTVLFGKSVIKDADGNYLQVVAGESPFVGQWKKAATIVQPFVRGTVTQSAKDIGMTETQFAKFITQRIQNPNLTPEQFKKTQSVFDVINRVSSAAPRPMTVESAGKAVLPQITKGRQLSESEVTPQLSSFIDKIIARQKAEAQAAALASKIKELSKANRQAKALYEAQQLAKNNNQITAAISPVIKSIISESALTRTIGVNPESFIKAYRLATPEVQAQVRANLSTKVVNALLTGNTTALKTALQNELLTQEQVQTIVTNATLLKNKLQMQGKTQTQIENQVKNYTKAQTETKTQPQTKAMVKPLVDTATQTLTQPQFKVQTKPLQKTATKIATKTTEKTTVKPTQKTTTKPKEPPDKPPPRRVPPPFIIKLQSGEEKELTQEELKGSPAWKQGFIYKMWLPPYNDASMINTTEPIPSVEYHSGAESAIRSAVILKGDLKNSLVYNMGIQDVRIDPTRNKKKPKLSFKLDRSQKTGQTGIISRRK